MKNENRKSLKDINDKQIDDFSNNLKEVTKKLKKEEKTNPEKKQRIRMGTQMILDMIDRVQMRSVIRRPEDIDWEKVASEIMVRYYEQQEVLKGRR